MASGVTIEGGYEAEFCSPVPHDFLCGICHLAFRSPVQLPCGHQFCKSCWQKCIKSSVMPTCPVDRQIIDLNKVFPDLAVERKVLSLLVKCKKEGEGCSWSGELRSLQVHMGTCPFQMVQCVQCVLNGCRRQLKRGDMEKHITTCIFQSVKCPHCNVGHPRRLARVHLFTCSEAPIECTNKCGAKDIPRSKLEDHLKNCSMTISPCCYAKVGCKFEGKKHLREKHEDDSVKEHLLLSTNYIKGLEDKSNIGSILWIIEGYKAKVSQARIPSIPPNPIRNNYYSSPFLSSKSGYKLRFCITFSYVSTPYAPYSSCIGVGLQLMKSSSDPILAWPFQCSYEVALHSEGGKKKTWIVNMRPTNRDFNHPMYNSRIPTKVIEEEGYLIGDSIYLRCTIITDNQDGGPVLQQPKKRKCDG